MASDKLRATSYRACSSCKMRSRQKILAASLNVLRFPASGPPAHVATDRPIGEGLYQSDTNGSMTSVWRGANLPLIRLGMASLPFWNKHLHPSCEVMNPNSLMRNDFWFAVVCALLYAAAVLAIPPYTPLIEPDSYAYITFSPFRPSYYPAFLWLCRAVGFNLVETTWVQLAIFSAALIFLLVVLRRSGFSKPVLGLMVAVLAGNNVFSSFHRSILTESIYFSLSLVAVALWIEYFRTARIVKLVGAGLVLGLMVGIRLAGLGILPLHVLAVFIRRPKTASLWFCIFAAIAPPVVGIGGERILYYAVHRSSSISQASYLLFAKAAMLIRPDMEFSGPHARSLDSIGAQLWEIYGPIQRVVAAAPSVAVRAQLSAIYEGLAQYSILVDELKQAAMAEKTSAAALRIDLAEQVIWKNPGGYLRLTLLNDFGQWSVAAQNFPLVSREMNKYADTKPAVRAGGRIPAILLHPRPTLVGVVVYPAFLIIGAVTLALAFGFIAFLVRPTLANSAIGSYLLIATFLSVMCHCYTLFISMVNEWTPRFLMAIFPHLEIIGACLVLAFIKFLKPKAVPKSADLNAASVFTF